MTKETKEQAEKEWHKFTHPDFEEYYHGIKDYKEALRAEVQKWMGSNNCNNHDSYLSGETFLQMLDLVTPINTKE